MSLRLSSRGNTPEIHMGDPNGLAIQLQDPSYCGGGGTLGGVCGDAASAPEAVRASLRALDLSHFTINVTDPARTNAFYRRTSGTCLA